MAPPSSRRFTGYSKKAQFSLFTGYLLAAAGAVLGLALLALSFWQPAALAPLRGSAQDAVTPAGEVTGAVRSGSHTIWDSLSGFINAGSQNARLKREIELARIQLAEAKSVAEENRRLKSLVALSESEIEPVAVARLVGSSASSSRRFAYIARGSSDGVRVGMSVRSPRGVVGRVLETSSGTSRILLLTDTESVLPVRRSTDETVAFAEGRGDGLLRIRLINLGLNPLEVGDVFVTSGAGGYYRPGVAVAILSEKTPDGGIARLIADPSGTDFVSIEPIYVPEAVEAAQTAPESELEELGATE